ncbi:hypothetical protein GCM10010912_00410 [Paenibacillus albidus]|uniref:Copper amine oxidase N-terminal domain-containing protein n=1 Tax=Paenibacillus albidus TaxID=2041023 RepID=A0A917BX79_9BACL|nr:hypothetical protein [Paenibacillus albidus]GGF59159.1 hypothetical protein GCM10010912_00410 [Paenibacillus albidus]
MKKMVWIFTVLLLVAGIGYPSGTDKAAAAASPEYTELATFVNGKLLISASKSLLVGSTTYVPVKLLDQIPGFTVQSTAGSVTLKGAKGITTLNTANSVFYKNSNYVAFKSLLKLGAIDGKYASSAESLFIWSTEEGRSKSSSTLYSISKLPENMAYGMGKKVYVNGYSGSHWITDVQYDGGSVIVFTLLANDGSTWKLDYNTYDERIIFTDVHLQYMRQYFNGLTVWIRNSEIDNSPFKNMEKLTIKDLRANLSTGELEVVMRRANGQEVPIAMNPSNEMIGDIAEMFFTENPRNVTSISDKMWSAIREEKVVVGMKFDEVYLAWGEPDSVNESLGYVVYGQTHVYFYNNKLQYWYDF